MSIVFVSSGSQGVASSGSVVPGLPDGIQDNDVLVCSIHSRDNIVSTMPVDWNLKIDGNGNANNRLSIFWKRVSGSDINPPVTHSGGNSIISRITAWRGCVDRGDPFDTISPIQANTTAIISTSSIDTISNECAILHVFGSQDDNNWGTYTGIPVTQAFLSGNSLGTDNSLGLTYGIQSISGSTGNAGARELTGGTDAGVSAQLSLGQYMIRFYLIPFEFSLIANKRGTKYLAWMLDPDPPGIVCDWGMCDYGSENIGLFATIVTPSEHITLSGFSDVLSVPYDIDSNLSQGAVDIAQTYLENRKIPADWINTGLTYRTVIRTIANLFQFSQRVFAIMGYPQNPLAGLALNMQVSDWPIEFRNAMQVAADEFGYDRTWVTETTTLRQVLKFMADQWGSKPILFGFVEL